jgi:hypothetical protein
MGIILVIGVMLYSVGMCRFFQRFSEQSSEEGPVDREWVGPVVIPDRVPVEWVDAYRTDQGS